MLWVFLIPVSDPQTGEPDMGLRIFSLVGELLQYNYSSLWIVYSLGMDLIMSQKHPSYHLICGFFFDCDYCCSVTQLYLTLCHPMDYSTPGFPVFHYLLELAQSHVNGVSDAIQPSRPLLPPSPPAFNLSQHQRLFNESALLLRWPKYWSFSISPSSGIFRVDFL